MKINQTILAIATLLPLVLLAEDAKYAPINPALLYWTAAANLPALNDQQSKEIYAVASGKLPVASAKTDISGIGLAGAEDLMSKAAASSAPCDWGLIWEDGPKMSVPHLSKMRQMAIIALGQGESSLAQGKTAEGLDWFLTAHRMARHCAADGTLVQNVIETLALNAAGRHCLSWDEPTRHGYADKLKTLPPLHSLPECYRGELSFIDWCEKIPQLSESMKIEALKILDSMIVGVEMENKTKKIRKLVEPETLRIELAAVKSFYSRIVAAFGKPWNEGAPELDAINEEINHSDYTLVKMFCSETPSVYGKAFVVPTLRAMLEAALEHGPRIDQAKAATYHDAFEGKPLRLVNNGDGVISLFAADQHPKGKIIELKLAQ